MQQEVLLKRGDVGNFQILKSDDLEIWGYESIEAYITSNKYKKYRLEYANWIDEGNFNSSKIPSFKKFFGTIDIPTTKVKN